MMLMRSNTIHRQIPRSFPRLWLHRFWLAWEIVKEYRRGTLEDVETHLLLHQKLADIIKSNINQDLTKVKILEIGCGQRASQTLLFTTDGADVVGVDIEVPTFSLDLQVFLSILRLNGPGRALKSLGRHLFFDSHFFEQLAARYGKSLAMNKVKVRVADAARMDFSSNCFDFIYSNLVFEHISQVDSVVQELNRLLKPEGIAWVNVHLFPSLSGGHLKEWTNPRSMRPHRVPPWDHLLENTCPIHTFLNKLTLKDYRRIFSEYLEVVEESFVTEGEEILTPNLAELLAKKGYSRDDLLTREIAFLCRKSLLQPRN